MADKIRPKQHRQWHPSGILENLKERDMRYKAAMAILGIVFALILLAVMLTKDQDLIQRALAPLPLIPESMGEIESTSAQDVPWRKAIVEIKSWLAGPFPDLALMKVNFDPDNVQAEQSFQLIFYSDLHLAVVNVEAAPSPLVAHKTGPVYALKTSLKHLVDPAAVRELLEAGEHSKAVELLKWERTKALARVKKR